MIGFLLCAAVAFAWSLLLSLSLGAARCLGRTGRALREAAARAPGLDLVLALLTWVPWVVAGWAGGGRGLAGTLAGQAAALLTWVAVHEALHRTPPGGPRIVSFINGRVGRWRNHATLWFTLVGLPVLWAIRLTEVLAYPVLVRLLGFPRYRHGEWVNVSRHKFEGLVGHDLVWCLYCDWMTGVYSLGAEMLRNVESFWCPIRFHDAGKCENCRLDFPDLAGGWTSADGSMGDVLRVLQGRYPPGRPLSWYGHPDRGKVERTEEREE